MAPLSSFGACKLTAIKYLKPQGRFSHMFEKGNEWMIEEVQQQTDRQWEMLLKLNDMK